MTTSVCADRLPEFSISRDRTEKTNIERLPILQHDPSRPEDILKVDADEDGPGGDDPADALRYLVATKPRRIEVRKLSGW